MKEIESKEIQKLKEQYPLLNKLISLEEVFWMNPNVKNFQTGINKSPLTKEDVRDAEERLKRFAPYIANVFLKQKKRMGS